MDNRENENMNSQMTVVFIGYDGYSDLWDDCFMLYNRFWGDRPYRTLFVNNEKEVAYKNVEVFHAGAGAEWSRKVQLAVQQTTTPYICLLLEDFFVGETINTSLIQKTVDYIQVEKIRYYKLVNMSRAVKNHDPQYKDQKFLHIIPQSDEYGVSLQAAIWEKGFLTDCLGTDNYNAWKFEFDRVKEASGRPDTANPGCVFDERNVLNLQHGVVQSKYLPGTIHYFRKRGISLNVQREVMDYPHYYLLRFESKAKHMLPRPMRGKVKKILEILGMKFVSTIRDE